MAPKEVAQFQSFVVWAADPEPGGKPRRHVLMTIVTATVLGEVRWHPQWRKYMFVPSASSLWSRSSLADVREFLRMLADRKVDYGDQ